MRPLSRARGARLEPLRISSNTVSVSRTGARETLCESYQARSYFMTISSSIKLEETSADLFIAQNLGIMWSRCSE